jgi:hypothetical protein
MIAGTAAPGDDVTLYRDHAVIRQRLELGLPATPTTVKAMLATGVSADQIVLIDRGGLAITGLHAQTSPDATPAIAEEIEFPLYEDDLPAEEPRAGETAPPDPAAEPPPARKKQKPTELALDVHAPRAGKYVVVVAYTTQGLHWDVAYTMTPRQPVIVASCGARWRSATRPAS